MARVTSHISMLLDVFITGPNDGIARHLGEALTPRVGSAKRPGAASPAVFTRPRVAGPAMDN